VLTRLGFDASFGNVTGIKDATKSPVASKAADPFKTPMKVDSKGPMETEMLLVYSIHLVTSPSRTTSRGKDVREDLGGDGSLMFFKSTSTGQMVVKYLVHDSEKFDDVVPLQEMAHRFIKGNAGFENVFSWNAMNKAHYAAGGTTIKNAKDPSQAIGNRRYYFWFESREELTVALFYLINQDLELVKEFFEQDGRFTSTKKSLPSHVVLADDDDMDTDDDRISIDEAPKLEDSLDYEPGGESQFPGA